MINTAQNVNIEYPAAGVGERAVASIIDYAIIILYYIGLYYLDTKIKIDLLDEHIHYSILLQLPVLFYDFIFELLLNGQSPGKKVMKIKVVKIDGTQPAIGSYLLRWLLRIIDLGLSFGAVALTTVLLNGKGQRLGDIAAGTSVVSLRENAAMKDTIHLDLEEEYVPLYTRAKLLDDRSIGILKETLDFYRKSKKKRKDSAAVKAVEEVKNIMEEKLRVTTPEEPEKFLEQILKDYNYLNGRVV
jgi:uncharacterized RDD family membrane protein YckC